MFSSIVYIDDTTLVYAAAFAGIILLGVALSPSPAKGPPGKISKIFGGIAIAAAVGFAILVWMYVRSV